MGPQYETTVTLWSGKVFASGVHSTIKEAQWCCGTAALEFIHSLPADSPQLQRSPQKSPPKQPASPRGGGQGHARSGR